MNTKLLVVALGLFPVIANAADGLPLSSSTTAQTSGPPATSSATAPTYESTGETVGSTTPLVGMTSRPGGDVFVTLTRTAFSAADLPNSADVVTPEQFAKFNAQNAGQAVAQQTSIQILPYGEQIGSPLFAGIRGASSAQTLVLIDGRPMQGFALGTPDLSEIPIESIDHIEILRGGASALYGPNAIGGVINIITKRATYPGHPVSDVAYEGGSYGTERYRLDFGSRTGPLDYFMYGDQQWESGFRDNSDARIHNIGGNFGVSMGSAGKFLFDASSFHNDTGVPGPAYGPQDPFNLSGTAPYLVPNQFDNQDEKLASSPTARQITDTTYLRTSYLLPLPEDMLLVLRAFGSQREVQYDDPNDPNPLNATQTDRHQQSKGGEAQLNLPLGLLVGGNYVFDREDDEDQLTPSNSFIKTADNWGVFAQEQFTWKTVTLIPSGRFDHNSQAGDTQNPRVQLIEDATEWLRFSGSAARSFRAPTIDELYFVSPSFSGNPSLQPETAWTYDAGFEVHPDSFTFRATYFRANVSNLIQVQPITFDTVVNVGEARRQGAEIQLDHVINRYVQDSWNYTYLENLGIPSGYDHWVPLALSPRHTVNYVLTLKPFTRWTVDSVARYEDTRYSGNDQTGTQLGSQIIWDMRLAYQLRQAKFYMGVKDITDKRYEEQPGYPLPGRTAYGGVTLKLWD